MNTGYRDLAKELARYIAFDSVCTKSNAPFARFMGQQFKKSGFRVSYQKTRVNGKSFLNVIGMKGKGKEPPLLLCSHLDTVPPGRCDRWTKTGQNPWKAKRLGDRLFGLGAADDKGPLLAMLRAASQFKGDQLERPLMILGSFGEENGMGGARLFIRKWKKQKPKLAFVGEPTQLNITYRHKGVGVLLIEIQNKKTIAPSRGLKTVKKEFHGKQGHSSRPSVGVNALEKVIHYLKAHPRLISQVVKMEGGSAPNIIPAHATLHLFKDSLSRSTFPAQAVIDCYDAIQSRVRQLKKRRDRAINPPTLTSTFGLIQSSRNKTTLAFDFRLVPGQSFSPILAELKKDLRKKLKRHHTLRWKLIVERNNLPLGLDHRHFLPQLAQKLLRANKLSRKLFANPGCTEAGTYSQWGVPSVVIGPGESYGNIHSPNESIKISELSKAIQFYASAIQAVCGKNSHVFHPKR